MDHRAQMPAHFRACILCGGQGNLAQEGVSFIASKYYILLTY